MELVPSLAAFASLVSFLTRFLNSWTILHIGLWDLFYRLVIIGFAVAVGYHFVRSVRSEGI